jgi:CHRD domain
VATALPAAAHPVTYSGTLSNVGEAVQNPPSVGTGLAFVTLDLDDFTMRLQFTFSGLSGTTTASHIHCCTVSPGTGSAGVATQVPAFIDFPLNVTSGSYDHTFDMTSASSYNPTFLNTFTGSNPLLAFAALATGIDSGNAYLNIHSSFAPGGEIRTFFSVVPLPAAAWLLMSGVLGFFGVSRRRPA